MSTAPSLRKRRAAGLSILSNSLLVVSKLVVGFLSGSIAAISEAVHSATDLMASCIAFASVRVSDNPPDAEHPYGHGKVESISSLAEAILIFLAATYIIYQSAAKLYAGTKPGELGAAIAVMGASVVVNFWMSRYLRKVARETDSQALMADAEHLHVDVLTAAGVFVGLGLSQATGLAWLDPAAALCVSLLIVKTGMELTVPALSTLLDACLPEEEEQQIRQLLDSDERVLGYHKLRTRKAGSQRHVDVHVQMPDQYTFVKAHEVSEELEDKIRDLFGFAPVHVHIHMEPYLHEMQHQIDVHGADIAQLNLKREQQVE